MEHRHRVICRFQPLIFQGVVLIYAVDHNEWYVTCLQLDSSQGFFHVAITNGFSLIYISYTIHKNFCSQYRFSKCTLPKTNSSHLKMDGWNTIVSFWGPAQFQVRTVRFREGTLFVDGPKITKPGLTIPKTPQGMEGTEGGMFRSLTLVKLVTRMGAIWEPPINGLIINRYPLVN